MISTNSRFHTVVFTGQIQGDTMSNLTSLQKKVLDVLSSTTTPLNGVAIQKQIGQTLSVAGVYRILSELEGMDLVTRDEESKTVGGQEVVSKTYTISEKGKELYSAESSSV